MANIKLWFNLIMSIVGISVGISAGISFYTYGNSLAVFWSLFSACLALLNLHLHCLKFKDKLEEWHSEHTMSAIKAFALVLSIIITGILVWYIFRILYERIGVYPIKDSLIVTAVWTFMSAKWGFFLYFTSSSYEVSLREASTPLLAS